MKILVRDTQIIGTATDDYTGPEAHVTAPEGFDPLADLDRYCYQDGALQRIAPTVVSRFQARAALLQAGMLETVTALMTADTTDPLARLAWSEALEFRRDSPTIATMAAALGLTDAQLDALFVTAAGISA